MDTLDHKFKTIQFIIDPDTFAIIKTSRTISNALAIIQTEKEVTVILKEQELFSISEEDILASSTNWRLVTFDTVLSFDMVGFLARVSGKLAQAGISIFVLSSYSTDHLLIKEDKLGDAISVLQQMGFTQK